MNTQTLDGMTQSKWDHMSKAQRESIRDNADLIPQLKGFEGYRVEVIDDYNEKRRFIVGKSTGWKPCHLEIKTRRSMCGYPADKHYKSVQIIEKVR